MNNKYTAHGMPGAFIANFPQRSMQARKGFTLIEVMLVIAILSIVLAIAVPGFSGLMQKNRVSSGTSEIISSLALARNEAITRRANVVLCANAGGMANGWKIMPESCNAATEDSLLVHEPLHQLDLCSAQACPSASDPIPESFSFNKMGGLNGGIEQVMVLLPDNCASGRAGGRAIRINSMGRVVSEPVACS
jgi:type IV fimbrial biogenesis protein FimT